MMCPLVFSQVHGETLGQCLEKMGSPCNTSNLQRLGVFLLQNQSCFDHMLCDLSISNLILVLDRAGRAWSNWDWSGNGVGSEEGF